MNSPAVRRLRHVIHGLAICSTALVVTACQNPFETSRSEYGMIATHRQLHTIDPMDFQKYELPDPESLTAEAEEEPEDPLGLKDVEKLSLSLEQCRAWGLEYNLELHVALIEPIIANETVSIEEARFESVFFTRADTANLNQPTSSTLSGSEVDSFNMDTGVRIPLRAGGTATVTLPITRTKTDNQFSTLNPAYTTDLRFSLVQPLLRNAGRRVNTHAIRIAALQSQIAQARAKLDVITQVSNIDRAYWRLYAAKKLLEVAQEQYELATDQLRRATERFDAGDVPEIEVIRAQSGVADRLENIIITENAVRREQRELKRIVNAPGLEIETPTLIELTTEPDPVPMKLDAAAVADASIDGRMEILELTLRIAQDESNVEFARNQLLPQFDVTGGYVINGLGGSFSESLGVTRGGRFNDWSVGANFEVPLGNEAAEGRFNQAMLGKLQRMISRDSRELLVRQEVYDSIDRLEAAWQRILAARQSTVLAARTYEGEQRQFEVGARTSTDVLDAATTLAESQASEIRALTDYQIAQVNLAFATGTLLGASRIDWEPYDPRTPDDLVGETMTRTRKWEEIGSE